MSAHILKLQAEVKSSNALHITSNWLNYTGVQEYFPEELVITVKASTSMAEICTVLAKPDQVLPFYLEDEA